MIIWATAGLLIIMANSTAFGYVNHVQCYDFQQARGSLVIEQTLTGSLSPNSTSHAFYHVKK